ncbi:MAG: hypothetical protein K8Q89_06285 [Nitrosarchaeum sp.]|nr:hypothetical protein [Nitrosarchaeum sp.]
MQFRNYGFFCQQGTRVLTKEATRGSKQPQITLEEMENLQSKGTEKEITNQQKNDQYLECKHREDKKEINKLKEKKIVNKYSKYDVLIMKKRVRCKICNLYLSSEGYLNRHYKMCHKDEIGT